ncbi:MAG: APC family permease [Alphaproteobacteria bacterium]
MRLRRLVFGSPLSTASLEEQKVGKLAALPLFASDGLSSVAYATEEMLLALLVGGTAFLHFSLPIALVIGALLAIVAVSYVQTVYAYPQGGGSYLVAHENLGEWAGLVAAAALLIDYVLTVAVSIAAGVRAATSAFPELIPYTVLLCVVAVVFMAWANLRGVRESAAVLAFPTYGFIAIMSALVLVGLWRTWHGDIAPHPAPALNMTHAMTELAVVLLVLRAFSSGCTALTGIEAVSNGVPTFKKPESRNAGITLILLGALMIALFLGVTVLARKLNVLPLEEESVVSQISRIVFGDGALYLSVQIATMLILVLAANTSFAGFPRLGSILARDGYLPRQLTNLGDRLAFSNGILALAAAAILLLVVFGGSTHALIPLYTVGVFLAFVLSQTGMVWMWFKRRGPRWRVKAAINGLGAAASFVALLFIVESKFLGGAWIVILLIPVLLYMFQRVKSYYREVSQQLSPRLAGLGAWLPWVHKFHPKVVLPVSRMHPGTMAALQFARAISDDITAVMVDLEPAQTARVKLAWRALRFKEPLVILESPYRSVIAPVMEFLESVDRREPERGPAVIVLPEFLPRNWWENFLHNQTALLLKAELLLRKGPRGDNRIVIDVPYRLRETG